MLIFLVLFLLRTVSRNPELLGNAIVIVLLCLAPFLVSLAIAVLRARLWLRSITEAGLRA